MSYGYTLLRESFPVARARHRCIWCGEPIEPGMKYRHERSVYDGDMQDHKWHPECDAAFKADLADEGGGTLEFSPWGNERPDARGVPESASRTSARSDVDGEKT